MSERRATAAATRLKTHQIPIAKSADLTTRRIAWVEAQAAAPGPTVWLTAGLHGDEVGGTVVVHEIFARVAREGLAGGRLAAFPLLNPFGFEAASRHIPFTHEDLNRAFPGDPRGTVGQRIAHLVHERIRADEPALVLDLHNDWIRSIPYALVDPRPLAAVGRAAHARVREAALATGLPVVDEQEEGISRAMLRSTLSGSLLELGVPALTLELGAALMIVEENVRIGVEAVWSVLVELGLVAGEKADQAAYRAPSPYRERILQYSHEPRPSSSGIVRFLIEPGEVATAGTALAFVNDVFGRRLETIRAESEVLVLGHADSSLAMPGVALFAMARRRERAVEPRK